MVGRRAGHDQRPGRRDARGLGHRDGRRLGAAHDRQPTLPGAAAVTSDFKNDMFNTTLVSVLIGGSGLRRLDQTDEGQPALQGKMGGTHDQQPQLQGKMEAADDSQP